MHIGKRHVGAGVTALFVASIVLQSLATAQAEELGYVQADCPTIVKQAIDAVGSECTKVGRNKLCYGNSTIQAVFQPGTGNVTFQAPGDTVDVSQLKQFTLGGMDTSTNTWGVAEMKIKADLPDTDPTQNVTMILFGDVQLTDGTADANAMATVQAATSAAQTPTVPVIVLTQTAAAINRQATPAAATATKLAGIVGTATAKASTPTATGTIPALKATQSAATATKLAALITTATAAPVLVPPTLPPGSGSFGAMQAFYFQSKDSAPCEQAPHDGILIQSPQGERVTLSVDGATVSLGSTVYITAQPSKFLTINTLEGSATITAVGQTQTANAGTAALVPLDANLRASGAPTTANFYTADSVRGLPTRVLPNTSVAFTPGVPPGITFTSWTQTFVDVETLVGSTGSCKPGGGPSKGWMIAFNDTNMWFNFLVFSRSSDSTYTGSYFTTFYFPSWYQTNTDDFVVHVDSPTHISETATVTVVTVARNTVKIVCLWNWSLTPDNSPPSTPYNSLPTPSPSATG